MSNTARLRNCFEGKTVLITGHTGFKGSWLSIWLQQLGARVVGISNEVPTSPANFDASQVASLVQDHRCDLADLDAIRDIVKQANPDFVFHLAGQVSLSDTGQPIGAGDFVEQTRQTYANIKTALAELGATMADITDETVFVTDVGTLMSELEPFAAVRAEAYGVPTPEVTQTCVQVAGLVMPELMIEIKCVAEL